MFLVPLATLGATYVATEKAQEDGGDAWTINDDKDPGLLNDYRTVGGVGCLTAASFAKGHPLAQALLLAAGLGGLASYASTEAQKKGDKGQASAQPGAGAQVFGPGGSDGWQVSPNGVRYRIDAHGNIQFGGAPVGFDPTAWGQQAPLAPPFGYGFQPPAMMGALPPGYGAAPVDPMAFGGQPAPGYGGAPAFGGAPGYGCAPVDPGAYAGQPAPAWGGAPPGYGCAPAPYLERRPYAPYVTTPGYAGQAPMMGAPF